MVRRDDEQPNSGAVAAGLEKQTKKAEWVGPISIEEEHPPIHVINPEASPVSWTRARIYVQ